MYAVDREAEKAIIAQFEEDVKALALCYNERLQSIERYHKVVDRSKLVNAYKYISTKFLQAAYDLDIPERRILVDITRHGNIKVECGAII